MSKTVTLVIHGTFADQAEWWRFGHEGHVTFADRLEAELSRRGLTGTVWKPVLEAGVDYSSFSWSGLNRHRDRVRGARRLGSSLNQLADRVRATTGDPLTVNFVAHSHGGNVVLEALRYLKANVRVGRVALLGTPLVTVRPAFRIGRFIFSTILLALLFVFIILALSDLGSLLFTGHLFRPEALAEQGGRIVREKPGSASTLLFALALIFYGWLFWVFGNLLDVVWRIFCRVFGPIAWIRGKARALVYGPSPGKLAAILGGRAILLITSRNDEAGVLLGVGSAPARLYREYVSTKPLIPARVLEFVFLRPFTLGVFLKAIEMLLEVLSLGFSVWSALVQDFEIAIGMYYPADLLVQERWDVRPIAVRLSAATDATVHSERIEGGTRLSISLSSSLQEVAAELKRQIQLRHCTYYEDDAIILHLAEFLTGSEVRGTSTPTTKSSAINLSPEFWEGLLIANLGLALLYMWISGPFMKQLGFPTIARAFFGFLEAVLAGYVAPFTALGLAYGISLVVRRRAPARSRRWFWLFWAIFALFFFLGALGERLGGGR
jgi:hypothetical protein